MKNVIKGMAFVALFTLTACIAPEDKAFPSAKFKISDQQVKELVFQSNNLEQCLYPELDGLTYAEAERKVYSRIPLEIHNVLRIFQYEKLRNIIGEHNFKIMVSDPESSKYFDTKISRLNNQVAKVNTIECEKFKIEFSDELERIQQNQKLQK